MTVGPLSVVRCADSDSKKPHDLMMGDQLIVCLTDHEATRIEAQIAGSSLRIVDVSESGLPRWPDLTDLTEAVDAVLEGWDSEDNNQVTIFPDDADRLFAAARRLVYPEREA